MTVVLTFAAAIVGVAIVVTVCLMGADLQRELELREGREEKREL